MCLSTSAFALFLTMVGADIVTLGDDRVIVHATDRDAHWVADGERWCTMAPQIDAMYRITPPADAADPAK